MKNKEPIETYSNKNPDILTSLNEDPKLLMSWLSGLTDIEQKILSVLYQENKAITVKEVKDILCKNSLHSINISHPISFNDSLKLFFPFSSAYKISPKKVIKEFQKKGLIDKIDKSKDLEISSKNFNEVKGQLIIENFPSFRRIDNTIKDLIILKIVFQRDITELENKKIKGLYYLNPVIRYQLDKLKNEKIEKETKRKEYIDNINKELIKSGSKITMDY